jgi:hypothetical protein
MEYGKKATLKIPFLALLVLVFSFFSINKSFADSKKKGYIKDWNL